MMAPWGDGHSKDSAALSSSVRPLSLPNSQAVSIRQIAEAQKINVGSPPR